MESLCQDAAQILHGNANILKNAYICEDVQRLYHDEENAILPDGRSYGPRLRM